MKAVFRSVCLFSLILGGLWLVPGCNPSAAPPQMAIPEGAALVSLEVEGMSCEGCSAHVQQTLAAVDGVNECQVDLASSTAHCVVFPDRFRQDDALARLAEEGYKSSMKN